MILGVRPPYFPDKPPLVLEMFKICPRRPFEHLHHFSVQGCSATLIYVTDVASWASPRNKNSEAEREKLCARLKLDAARASALEMETPPTDIAEFNIADVLVKIKAPPVRSDIIGYEDEHENDSDEPSWLEQLHGTAKFRKQAIGRLDARLIHRDRFVGFLCRRHRRTLGGNSPNGFGPFRQVRTPEA